MLTAKKIQKITILGLITLSLLLGIKVFPSFNFDRAFIYRTLSWISCQYSPAPSCLVAHATTELPKASGKNGVVVSTQREASKIGLQILAEGGNAIG